MSGSFLRREWGAVTFVLTVLLGVVIVPVALYFGNQSPTIAAAVASPSPAVSASPAPSASGSPSPGASGSPSPGASASPGPSPSVPASPSPTPTVASGPRQVSPSP